VTAYEVDTVRFGPLERRGLLLGLNLPQLVVLTLALVIVIGGMYGAGMTGLLAGSPVWAPLVVIATASVRGRPVMAWLPLLGSWQVRNLTGATTQISRPALPPPSAVQLPGIAGTLAVARAPALGAALVRDRRAGTVTAIARVHGAGFVLDDAAAQEHKVGAWGRVLATTCQMPQVVRVQVLARTVPGGSATARAWWQRNATTAESWAGRVVADLLDDVAGRSCRPEAFVAVALRVPRGNARRLPAARIGHAEQELSAVADALRGAELTVEGWVDVDGLGAVLRSAYDPTGAHDSAVASLEPGGAPSGAPTAAPSSALVGAMGAQERWAYLRTDSAVHATYWVAQWPRSEVHPSFLEPLLVSPGVFRTVSLIAEPVATARALREIRRAKVEHAADATRRARIGQVEDEATRAEVTELGRREAELVAGHGDLRFTGLITVTAPTPEDLESACTATEAAAAQSMCEVRRLVGQQAAAHAAAALPLARGVL
jgi:hypothetical protein